MGKTCGPDCPKRFPLGSIFSPNATSKHQSECCSGGGYLQYYEITCKICGEEWEENSSG